MNTMFTRFSPPRGLFFTFCLSLAGCGGGGGGDTSSSTPEPGPGPTPTPVSVIFNAAPVIVNRGESSTLSWSSSGASSCVGEGPGFAGSKAMSGSWETPELTEDALYRLRCNGNGGSDNKTVSISVIMPVELTFAVSPTIVNYGESSTLSWNVSGNASSCTGEGPGFTGPKSMNDSWETPELTENTTYGLQCTGVGGTDQKSVSVSVNVPVIEFGQCTVTEPPPELGVDLFYKKFCGNPNGFYVTTSENVPDAALEFAYLQIGQVASLVIRPEVLYEMVRLKHNHLAIIAEDECIHELPEVPDSIYEDFDRTCETLRGVGFGVTPDAVVIVAWEPNVLCYYNNELNQHSSILIHEFGHVFDIALTSLDLSFNARVGVLYEDAKVNRTEEWGGEGTYALINKTEYFAEGFAARFNTRGNTLINTEESLKKYDLPLYSLFREFLQEDVGIAVCP